MLSPETFANSGSRNIAHKRHSSVLTQRQKSLKEIRQLGFIKPALEVRMDSDEENETSKKEGGDYTYSPHINFPTSNLVIKKGDVGLK